MAGTITIKVNQNIQTILDQKVDKSGNSIDTGQSLRTSIDANGLEITRLSGLCIELNPITNIVSLTDGNDAVLCTMNLSNFRGVIGKTTAANFPSTGVLQTLYIDETEDEIYIWDAQTLAYKNTANLTSQQILDALGYTPANEATVTSNLALKVDKVTGKSLIADTEIARLADLQNNFKGKFTTTAQFPPSGVPGNYVQLDEGAAFPLKNYNWDVEDGWVVGSTAGTGATNTDELIEGSSNLYFTGARVLSTILSGLSLATGGAVVSTDTVLVAIGKIEKKITDGFTATNIRSILGVITLSGSNTGDQDLSGKEPLNVPPIADTKVKVFNSDDSYTYEDYGGGTGTSAPNTWYVILIEANTAQQNADAINAAIQLAIPTRGKVVINSRTGDWLCRTINWDVRVNLEGSGGTTLKSVAAEPLIKEIENTFINGASHSISNIVLNGDNIGTIGIDITANIYFKYYKVKIQDFTQIGLKTVSHILGTFEGLVIVRCPIGIYSREGMLADNRYMASNALIFNDCKIVYSSTYAIDKDKGSGIFFNNCDFEHCGTDGNANTGVIKWTNIAPTSESPTLIVNGGWMEKNWGTLFVLSGTDKAKVIFENTLCKYDYLGTTYFNVTGSLLSIKIADCDFDTDKSFGTFTDSKLLVEDTSIGTVTLSGAATYRKNNSENLTGSVLNMSTPNGDNYNYTTASPTTTYTTRNKVEGAFVSCKINAATEPTVTGGAKISGSSFVANVDMEMIVEVKNGGVRYFFLTI